MDTTEAEQGWRWWHRLRATLGLLILVALLGALGAAALGLMALAVGALFDQALG